MKRLAVILALGLAFALGLAVVGFPAVASRSDPSMPDGLGGDWWPSLTVVDSYGLSIERNYMECDAVGTVIVRGNYDYIERDGQIEIFLGYDGGSNPKDNDIYVSVWGAPWCQPWHELEGSK